MCWWWRWWRWWRWWQWGGVMWGTKESSGELEGVLGLVKEDSFFYALD